MRLVQRFAALRSTSIRWIDLNILDKVDKNLVKVVRTGEGLKLQKSPINKADFLDTSPFNR